VFKLILVDWHFPYIWKQVVKYYEAT